MVIILKNAVTTDIIGASALICAKAPALLHTIAFGPPVQRSNIEKGKQHVHITMKMILTSQTH